MVQSRKSYVDSFSVTKVTKYDFPKCFTEIIKNLPKGAKILDVGCAGGTTIKYCYSINKDLQYYGIDLEKSKSLPEYVIFKKCSAEDILFTDNMFDFIICSHVIEHVFYPQKIVEEIQRTLKKDKKGIIMCPYYRSLFLPDGWVNFYCDYTHVRPFTKLSMSRIIKDCGLHPITIKIHRNKISLILSPYLFLKGLLGDTDASDNAIINIVGTNLFSLFEKKN